MIDVRDARDILKMFMVHLTPIIVTEINSKRMVHGGLPRTTLDDLARDVTACLPAKNVRVAFRRMGRENDWCEGTIIDFVLHYFRLFYGSAKCTH